MKRIILLTITAGGLLLEMGRSQQSVSPDTHDSIVREIQQAAQALSDALVRGDAVALRQIYADGYVHIDQDGARTGKLQRLAEIGSGQRRYLAPLQRAEEPQYDIHGDTVVVTSRLTPASTQTFKGEPVAARPTLATRVWLKHNGLWQVILTQVTPITVHRGSHPRDWQRAETELPAISWVVA